MNMCWNKNKGIGLFVLIDYCSSNYTVKQNKKERKKKKS